MNDRFLINEEPIIACSSGLDQNVAVSLIRLSGFKNLDFLKPHIKLKTIKPRYSYFVKLYDGDLVIDEILLVYFKAPHSYNGENILELSVHGNVLNVKRIINLFIKNGFIYAHPGEFTYRALKNKKLSLSQVEGLDLFLNATNPLSLKQGLSLLNGKLQDSFRELHDSFLIHKASLELGIDFSEDVGEETFNDSLKKSFDRLESAVLTLSRKINLFSSELKSPEIVLFGRPNAGKSTFFNKLLKFDRSIVSEEAGTTRDYVNEKISIEDISFNLVDTAGLRVAENKVEARGIELSLEKAKNAFYKILLINPFDPETSEFLLEQNLRPDLVIFTHEDLDNFDSYVGPIEPIFKSGPIEPTGKHDGPIGPEIIKTSLNKIDLSLEEDIFKKIISKYNKLASMDPLLVDRQKFIISDILIKFQNYKQIILSPHFDISIASFELNTLGHCISELIGIVSPDEILESIFSNFCIGK